MCVRYVCYSKCAAFTFTIKSSLPCQTEKQRGGSGICSTKTLGMFLLLHTQLNLGNVSIFKSMTLLVAGSYNYCNCMDMECHHLYFWLQ
jgi:hypothetical protein